MLACADDIKIIRHDIMAGFRAVEHESAGLGLAVNGGVIIYVLLSNRNVLRIGSQLTTGNNNFFVNEFLKLAFVVT